MLELNNNQIRRFWLHCHHLDKYYDNQLIEDIVGSIGIQNSPPGSWYTALYNRIDKCTIDDLDKQLYKDRNLLQAWSFRGAPVIFPVKESNCFLLGLIPQNDEPWIYTRGITLALDLLEMSFEELLDKLKLVIIQLDHQIINSKTSLDQFLATSMLPLIPKDKQEIWNNPSIYGNPDKQTIGGAVVSFLLRPCSFCGLVVFAKRSKTTPSFTSYYNWTGHHLNPDDQASQKLIRKFLHCYGPGTPADFKNWLGCSTKQAKRIWNSIINEIEPVLVNNKKAFILAKDKELFLSSIPLQRDLHLISSHDPILDQRNKTILLENTNLHKYVWKTQNNPGVVLKNGKIIGIWTYKKNKQDIEITITLWDSYFKETQMLLKLVQDYASFRQLNLSKCNIIKDYHEL